MSGRDVGQVAGAGRGRRGLVPILFAAALAPLAGCGGSGSGQTGSGFTFLSIDSISPVPATSVVNTSASTVVCFTVSNNLKNPTVTAPTSLDNVVIESYTVKLNRFDGGPSPGTFTLGSGVLVPAGASSSGSPTVTGNTRGVPVIVVPGDVKGGIGGPGTAIAEVVLDGRNARGQRLSAEGSVPVSLVTSGTDSSGGTCTGAAYGASLFPPVRPVYAMLSLILLIGLVVPQLTRQGRKG